MSARTDWYSRKSRSDALAALCARRGAQIIRMFIRCELGPVVRLVATSRATCEDAIDAIEMLRTVEVSLRVSSVEQIKFKWTRVFDGKNRREKTSRWCQNWTLGLACDFFSFYTIARDPGELCSCAFQPKKEMRSFSAPALASWDWREVFLERARRRELHKCSRFWCGQIWSLQKGAQSCAYTWCQADSSIWHRCCLHNDACSAFSSKLRNALCCSAGALGGCPRCRWPLKTMLIWHILSKRKKETEKTWLNMLSVRRCWSLTHLSWRSVIDEDRTGSPGAPKHSWGFPSLDTSRKTDSPVRLSGTEEGTTSQESRRGARRAWSRRLWHRPRAAGFNRLTCCAHARARHLPAELAAGKSLVADCWRDWTCQVMAQSTYLTKEDRRVDKPGITQWVRKKCEETFFRSLDMLCLDQWAIAKAGNIKTHWNSKIYRQTSESRRSDCKLSSILSKFRHRRLRLGEFPGQCHRRSVAGALKTVAGNSEHLRSMLATNDTSRLNDSRSHRLQKNVQNLQQLEFFWLSLSPLAHVFANSRYVQLRSSQLILSGVKIQTWRHFACSDRSRQKARYKNSTTFSEQAEEKLVERLWASYLRLKLSAPDLVLTCSVPWPRMNILIIAAAPDPRLSGAETFRHVHSVQNDIRKMFEFCANGEFLTRRGHIRGGGHEKRSRVNVVKTLINHAGLMPRIGQSDHLSDTSYKPTVYRSKSEVRENVKWFLQESLEENLMIYYSGHGGFRGMGLSHPHREQAILIPHQPLGGAPTLEAYTNGDLTNDIRRSLPRGKTLYLVIDADHGENSLNVWELASGNTSVILLAGANREISAAYDETGGVFTETFVSQAPQFVARPIWELEKAVLKNLPFQGSKDASRSRSSGFKYGQPSLCQHLFLKHY